MDQGHNLSITSEIETLPLGLEKVFFCLGDVVSFRYTGMPDTAVIGSITLMLWQVDFSLYIGSWVLVKVFYFLNYIKS